MQKVSLVDVSLCSKQQNSKFAFFFSPKQHFFAWVKWVINDYENMYEI